MEINGQIDINSVLADGLMYQQELGQDGKAAFYQGGVAQAIVDVINQHGGVMTLDDLRSHESEVMTPISTEYKVRSVINDCLFVIIWS